MAARGANPSQRRSRARHGSFQTLLVFLVSAQIVAAVVLVGWLTLGASYRAVEAQLAELVARTTNHVRDHLEFFLAQPRIINELNAQAVEVGLFNPYDHEQSLHRFWRLGQIFDGVGTIGFAGPAGGFVGANHPEEYLVLSAPPAPGRLVRRAARPDGRPGPHVDSQPGYDARNRPWYREALRARRAAWTPISASIGRDRLEATAVYPLFAADDALVGVFMVDVPLDQLSEFLRGLKVGRTGEAFIIDRDGRLVASSVAEQLLVSGDDAGDWDRKRAVQSDSPLVRAVANTLGARERAAEERGEAFEVALEGRYSVRTLAVEPLAPELTWTAVVAIPHAALSGSVRSTLRKALYLSAGILLLAVVVGSLTGRWIAQPLLRLNRAARAVADGELAHRVEIEREDEIGELAASFNQMIARLEASFADLEARNRELTEHKQKLRRLASEALLTERRERRRIASDVHDTTVQSLAIARIRLGRLRRELEGSSLGELARDVTKLVDDAIAQARLLLYELSPPALYELGLGPALEWLTEQFQERFGLTFRLYLGSELPEPDEDCRTVLFQAARELLTNVVKHAGARAASLSLTACGGQLVLKVMDDGKGFDPGRIEEPTSSVSGFGLFSIRERLELLNGRMKIVSALGQGTRVILAVPITDSQEVAS